MRMRVGIAGWAVCGPACVADAERTGGGVLRNQVLQPRDAAHAFAKMECAVGQRAQSRGIIAAIFQFSQPFDKNGRCVLFTDVSYDSAHSYRVCKRSIG